MKINWMLGQSCVTIVVEMVKPTIKPQIKGTVFSGLELWKGTRESITLF